MDISDSALVAIFCLLLIGIHPGLASAKPAAQQNSLIERIEKAVDWISEQSYLGEDVGLAYIDETNTFSGRLYTQVNARVAWTFQNHYQHLTSRKHETRLRAAVDFVTKGQAPTKDFYEYYDTTDRAWKNSGRLHHWNAHVSAMLSLCAINMRRLPEFVIKHEYWRRVIDQVEAFVEAWSSSGMKEDGSWVFTFGDSARVIVAENGMMLTTLACLSAYESNWGSASKAMRYSSMAHKTAGWVLGRQEMDETSRGWGGFYDDNERTRQTSLQNAKAMHGILAYWEFISVTVEDDKALYDMLRERLVAWAEGFFAKMRDESAGPYLERTIHGVSMYPKETLTAAELTRDIAMIWVDHGELRYWNWTEATYLWAIGHNEVRFDLQQASNLKGQTGGFYAGIKNSTAIEERSTTTITATCAEAMLHALYIDIPEFPRPQLVTLALFVTVTIALRCCRRNRNNVCKLSAQRHIFTRMPAIRTDKDTRVVRSNAHLTTLVRFGV